jgi:hypothetical protein
VRDAGIATRVGNHSFCATGITTYLKNRGTLEKAAALANYASTCTTQIYKRRPLQLPWPRSSGCGFRRLLGVSFYRPGFSITASACQNAG